MVEVIRAFCWHQKFVPKGLYALAPGQYTYIKSLKICIKSDFKETCNIWAKRKGLSVDIKILSPAGFLALPRVYIHRIESFKMCLKSYFNEIVVKLARNGQSDKGFLLTSTVVPKRLSAPALGLYTCIKALKYIPGPGVRWAFTGPLVLWLWRTDENYLWIFVKYPPYLLHWVLLSSKCLLYYRETEVWRVSLVAKGRWARMGSQGFLVWREGQGTQVWMASMAWEG